MPFIPEKEYQKKWGKPAGESRGKLAAVKWGKPAVISLPIQYPDSIPRPVKTVPAE